MATTTKNRTFSTSISLPENVRSKVIGILNARLADTIDLRTQAKQAHWNLKGRQFLQLHELFDTVAEHLDTNADTIAERVTALGGTANGTAREVARASSIPEYDLEAVNGEEHLRALIQRFAQVLNAERQDIISVDDLGDLVTADLFTAIVREGDKDLWFLEAHLQD